MNKLLTGILLLVITTVFVLPQVNAQTAQLLWLSASTLKKNQFIAMGQWFYSDMTKVYDTVAEEWKDEDNDYLKWGFVTMFGYAPIDKWELNVYLPYYIFSFSTPSNEGDNATLGDIYVALRYGIMPYAKDKHGLQLIGAARFGTGDDDNDVSFLRTGDGTTDFALGGIFTTAWMKGWRGHLKGSYWLNGKDKDDFDLGDEIQFILKIDRTLSSKVFAFGTYSYTSSMKRKDPDGNTIANSEQIRHNLGLGITWTPKKTLFIRPKVALPLGGKNGRDFSFQPALDVWHIFSL